MPTPLRKLPLIPLALTLASCTPPPDQPPIVKVEKPFASAGALEMQLDAGDYTIRAAPDDHIRVSFSGNAGNATAGLTTAGTHATLAVKDTPHNNFRASVEVPKTADLTVHLVAGNVSIAGITGNKDLDSRAANIDISVPNANDYSTVDASVKVGNVNAGPFGSSSSGLSPHLQWSGPGMYQLHVSLGAGNVTFKR